MAADDEIERLQAIRQAKAGRDIEYLIRALVDPDHRAQAATFLGQPQATEATPALLRLLGANDPHVRVSAVSPSVGLALRKQALVRDIALHDSEAIVRAWAVWPNPRRRLQRSPREWHRHRNVYNEAIANLTRGPRDEPYSDGLPPARLPERRRRLRRDGRPRADDSDPVAPWAGRPAEVLLEPESPLGGLRDVLAVGIELRAGLAHDGEGGGAFEEEDRLLVHGAQPDGARSANFA